MNSKASTILSESLDYTATTKEIDESIPAKSWECPCCLDICQCPACRSQRKPRVDLDKENEGCPLEYTITSPFIDLASGKSERLALGWNFSVRSPTLVFKKVNASYYSSKMGLGKRNSWPFIGKDKLVVDNKLTTGIIIPKPRTLTPIINSMQANNFIKIPNFMLLSANSFDENEIGYMYEANKISFKKDSPFMSRQSSKSPDSPMAICSDL